MEASLHRASGLKMLNFSCVLAVGSVAMLVLTVVTMAMPRVRAAGRRAAIVSAFAVLASAAAFSHYADLEAHARGFDTFSNMLAASKAGTTLARS